MPVERRSSVALRTLASLLCLWLGAVGGAEFGLARAQVPDFPVKVEVVRVNVLVKGRDGSLPDLTAADFELRDNGVPQEIEVVASGHTPLSLILALDVSGSVEGPASSTRAAGVAKLSSSSNAPSPASRAARAIL